VVTETTPHGAAAAPRGGDILIVDDTAPNLQVLSSMLRAQGHRVRSALSGALALRAARSRTPDVVLLDVMMPDMDGYEVCSRLKADPALRHVPVIFLSALQDAEDKVRAFRAGAGDYITKPFHLDEVVARVQTHLHLHRLQRAADATNSELQARVDEQVAEVVASQTATIFALAKLAESRDDATGRHLEHVQVLTQLLAERLRAPDAPPSAERLDESGIADIVRASALHDIGKVAIPDRVLLKPGRLTTAERETMRTHAVLGARTLASVLERYPRHPFLEVAVDVARSHHERWDGSGYPDGLRGEDIPLCARIVAVADVYDAARSLRCYKSPMTHTDARRLIERGAGTDFDPRVVAAFSELHHEFDRHWCEGTGMLVAPTAPPRSSESPVSSLAPGAGLTERR